MSRILIVEDEAIAALHLRELLVQGGHEVVGVEADARAAVDTVARLRPDLVLMDIFLRGPMTGIEASQRILDECDTPVIFLTAHAQQGLVADATRTQPFGYLIKPYKEAEILAGIEIALLKHRAVTTLRELNQTREKFFTLIAHDIRNPLVALCQTTAILQERASQLTPEDLRFFLRELHETSTNLYQLTENMLQWASTQSNRVAHRPQPLLLRPAVGHACQLLSKNAELKRITLDNAVASEVLVQADPDMLVSILTNLLSNAIKFSHPGQRVTVTSVPVGGWVRATVTDAGVGMEARHLARLFEAGHRQLGTQAEKGTGLGLVLVREFVEKHRGSLSAESVTGQGTAISFTLPAGSADP